MCVRGKGRERSSRNLLAAGLVKKGSTLRLRCLGSSSTCSKTYLQLQKAKWPIHHSIFFWAVCPGDTFYGYCDETASVRLYFDSRLVSSMANDRFVKACKDREFKKLKGLHLIV